MYSYVVRYDIGFAPNPFHGWCTLGTCKQDIRARAGIGDWIVGTGSASAGLGGQLVYAMEVEETLSFQEYWDDPRFRLKRPNLRGSLKQQYGDNVYHQSHDGSWLQANCRHSAEDGSPNAGHVIRDTKSTTVLASQRFSYFGGDGPGIPGRLRTAFGTDLVHGRPGYRANFPEEMMVEVIAWLAGLDRGVLGMPRDWKQLH